MLTFQGPDAQTTFYASPFSAGFDIRANESCLIEPGQFKAVATGLRIVENGLELPEAFTTLKGPDGKICRVVPELQIRPRSGLAAKNGVTVLNSPGTIDADYRGEIKIILINHSRETFRIEVGDRIAQGVCHLCLQIPQFPVSSKERGEGGFGSTGKS